MGGKIKGAVTMTAN